MIGYRFLLPAEEEMTEASLFYEAASAGLGGEFLDDVQRVIDVLREHSEVGPAINSEHITFRRRGSILGSVLGCLIIGVQ